MKLVCIGTVADVAELKGENRLFVKHGLESLQNVTNTGLKSLIEGCGLAGRKISEGDLGFRLGPRINAAGRMGMTDIAVRLFFSDSSEESQALVKRLEELNSKRQRTEEKIFSAAKAKIEERGLAERYKCLVLGSEDWHRGVIGIVASKLKDHFNRPVILFAYENGKAFGSGRSIPECPLIDLVEGCRQYFLSYGGHRLAVGCSLKTEDMPAFKAAINELAAPRISDEDLKKKVRIDADARPRVHRRRVPRALRPARPVRRRESQARLPGRGARGRGRRRRRCRAVTSSSGSGGTAGASRPWAGTRPAWPAASGGGTGSTWPSRSMFPGTWARSRSGWPSKTSGRKGSSSCGRASDISWPGRPSGGPFGSLGIILVIIAAHFALKRPAAVEPPAADRLPGAAPGRGRGPEGRHRTRHLQGRQGQDQGQGGQVLSPATTSSIISRGTSRSWITGGREGRS